MAAGAACPPLLSALLCRTGCSPCPGGSHVPLLNTPAARTGRRQASRSGPVPQLPTGSLMPPQRTTRGWDEGSAVGSRLGYQPVAPSSPSMRGGRGQAWGLGAEPLLQGCLAGDAAAGSTEVSQTPSAQLDSREGQGRNACTSATEQRESSSRKHQVQPAGLCLPAPGAARRAAPWLAPPLPSTAPGRGAPRAGARPVCCPR